MNDINLRPELRRLAERLSLWDALARDMRQLLKDRSGVLIGESGVLSTCVHLLYVTQPGIVTVLPDHDAGSIFYQREKSGEILHLDVFHDPGEVDHVQLARALCSALAEYPASDRDLANYVDVQTATGGGRITGTLVFGQKETLRYAHRNHVHLALILPDEHLAAIFYCLAATEAAIERSGLRLRRVEGVRYEGGGRGKSLPLSDYSSPSDSHLKGSGGNGAGQGDAAQGGDSAAEAELKEAAAQVLRRCDSLDDAKAVMRALRGMPTRRQVEEAMSRQGMPEHAWRSALEQLQALDALRQRGQYYHLTGRGYRLQQLLEYHGHELRLIMRKAMHRLLRDELVNGRHRGRRSGHAGKVRRRRVQPWANRGFLNEVAWPETVVASARRQAWHGKRSAPVVADDLRVVRHQRMRQVDICLLLDASASMSGQRMRAAKALARHLLLATRARVGVIVFQERAATITVPLTRSPGRVERGLARIEPFGLTPMAAGMALARDYLRSARARNPLLLVITDGIPTVPHSGKNPLDDAIQEAGRWRKARAGFVCIGLQPNQRYLRDLVSAAGGQLHIVDELHADTLVAIATAEHQRLAVPSAGSR